MNWETLLNKNRPRPSTSSGDHRAEFERDFDRAVFSTPVRRLQDKTQVFPLDPHDAVRTRLTHSLEVSSVARGLATGVCRWLREHGEIADGMDRSIETIAATCGLVHDLGNPPFGHSGEYAMRFWFQNRFGVDGLKEALGGHEQATQDFLKFEGNAQSLRLVAKLQILADYHGLNLTFGTLSASCKYIAPSHQAAPDAPNHAMRKPGYFASENQLIDDIRNATGTGLARNPIVFLVEAADDIVYSAGDIEDGIKKSILRWRDVLESLRTKGDPIAIVALRDAEKILKAGRSTISDELRDDIHASAFRTASIGRLVRSVIETFTTRYDGIMAGTYGGELTTDAGSQGRDFLLQLQEIARAHVFSTAPTLKLEIMGRRVICDLMDVFWEGAEHLPIDNPPSTKDFPGKIGALMSDNYRRVFQHFAKDSPLPTSYHRFQLVTDYVCGMTDSFAKRLHAELTNAG